MKYVRNIALAGLVGVEKFILVGRILINMATKIYNAGQIRNLSLMMWPINPKQSLPIQNKELCFCCWKSVLCCSSWFIRLTVVFKRDAIRTVASWKALESLKIKNTWWIFGANFQFVFSRPTWWMSADNHLIKRAALSKAPAVVQQPRLRWLEEIWSI